MYAELGSGREALKHGRIFKQTNFHALMRVSLGRRLRDVTNLGKDI